MAKVKRIALSNVAIRNNNPSLSWPVIWKSWNNGTSPELVSLELAIISFGCTVYRTFSCDFRTWLTCDSSLVHTYFRTLARHKYFYPFFTAHQMRCVVFLSMTTINVRNNFQFRKKRESSKGGKKNETNATKPEVNARKEIRREMKIDVVQEQQKRGLPRSRTNIWKELSHSRRKPERENELKAKWKIEPE